MPPRTTQRFWMRMRSRDWWERAVLREFSDREWRRNKLLSRRSFKKKKMCAITERNHASPGWDRARSREYCSIWNNRRILVCVEHTERRWHHRTKPPDYLGDFPLLKIFSVVAFFFVHDSCPTFVSISVTAFSVLDNLMSFRCVHTITKGASGSHSRN